MPALVTPTVDVHASFLVSAQEYLDEGRRQPYDHASPDRDLAAQVERWRTPDGFADYVAHLVADAVEDETRPPGIVPSTTLWWVDGSEYLGRIQVRHRLSTWLREWGGHVGYDVRPSARRRGHATAMLAAALPVAHRLGLDPVLVTCDEPNVASRRVIEANGGVLEDVRTAPGVPPKLRFWVPTSPPGAR
ncbi:GNAT family N-acetyltransferase [Solicola sp. PLA-1-18]|uniref:GNAT family N-acetyltransferase n=1 Tax=Solicola sp. PLA-1-18 TaxID=3380532 RepID=UPI003B7BE91B